MFACDVDVIPKKELYLYIKNDYDLLHEGAHLEMLYYIMALNGKKKNVFGIIHLLYLIKVSTVYL